MSERKTSETRDERTPSSWVQKLHRLRPTRLGLSAPSLDFAKRVVQGFVLPLMLALVLFAGLVYFIFPTTTWLDQRAEAAEVRTELDALLAEQEELRTSIARMRTDDEVERIARREFNFVYPGEEAYAVLPAPPEAVSLPASWPFSLLYAEVLD